MSTIVSIRLDDQIAQQLAEIARASQRSRSFHVQKAVEAYLEDYAELQIALDRFREAGDPILSSREMKQELGL